MLRIAGPVSITVPPPPSPPPPPPFPLLQGTGHREATFKLITRAAGQLLCARHCAKPSRSLTNLVLNNIFISTMSVKLILTFYRRSKVPWPIEKPRTSGEAPLIHFCPKWPWKLRKLRGTCPWQRGRTECLGLLRGLFSSCQSRESPSPELFHRGPPGGRLAFCLG